MKEVCPDQVVGADAFFPVWVYCIVKSNLPNLATLVNFLKGYLNPSLRYCEIGYYVTCLEGACVYIQVSLVSFGYPWLPLVTFSNPWLPLVTLGNPWLLIVINCCLLLASEYLIIAY